MGPKIMAIVLIVVAAGLVLFFFSSGGLAKLLAFVAPPSHSTSTVTVVSSTIPVISTSTVAAASSTTAPKPATSSNGFFDLLYKIFHPTPLGGGGTVGGSVSGGTTTGGGSTTPKPTPTSTVTTSTIPANQIPRGYTLAQLSPYFHLIRFNGVSRAQIGLSAPGGATQATTTINITGWQIKTNRGGEFVPQAVNIYDPSASAVLSDIYLVTRRGDTVYLYSNSAPVNLRLNKCMGFLGTQKQFNPALPGSCPSIDRYDISTFTGQCQNYILSLGCRQPDLSSTQIPRGDYACQEYLKNNFTYKSCISSHGADKDFFLNQWRAWMGSSPLDPYHDNVVLLDRAGLVVDTYSF